MIIAHSKPTLDASDARIVADVIKSGHIAQGTKVAAFEQKFARYQNVKHGVAVSSGTSALHLSLLALGIKGGDNVIIPSFVCAALMNAVRYTGAGLRIADIDRDFNISVLSVRQKINNKTKAIIVPHMFGLPADLTPLLNCGVPIIEDCAQAVGAEYKGKSVGSYGVLSIYSFYATKMMTTGEGGMVTSNNRMLISRIRDLRDYDKKNDDKVRFNFKMTDMQAALGIHQLSRVPAWIRKRRKIAQTYDRALRNCDLELPRHYAQREHVYSRYVIQTDNKRKLLDWLRSKGIHGASPVFKPLHQYLHLRGYPCAQQMMNEAVSLPIYPSLSSQEVRHILKHVKAFF